MEETLISIQIIKLLLKRRRVGSTTAGAPLEEPAVGGVAGALYKPLSAGVEHVRSYERLSAHSRISALNMRT